MNIKPGIKLIEERPGTGAVAERGDWVTYNLRAFLNRGDEIPINTFPPAEYQNIVTNYPEMFNKVDGVEFINHRSVLGKRQVWAGIEYSLYGMREGGYRKVRVSPHLAYGKEGRPGQVPADAVVTFEIWLRKIDYKSQPTSAGDSPSPANTNYGKPDN